MQSDPGQTSLYGGAGDPGRRPRSLNPCSHTHGLCRPASSVTEKWTWGNQIIYPNLRANQPQGWLQIEGGPRPVSLLLITPGQEVTGAVAVSQQGPKWAYGAPLDALLQREKETSLRGSWGRGYNQIPTIKGELYRSKCNYLLTHISTFLCSAMRDGMAAGRRPGPCRGGPEGKPGRSGGPEALGSPRTPHSSKAHFSDMRPVDRSPWSKTDTDFPPNSLSSKLIIRPLWTSLSSMHFQSISPPTKSFHTKFSAVRYLFSQFRNFWAFYVSWVANRWLFECI